MLFLRAYLAGLLTLAIVDGVWLMLMSKSFYQKHLGSLMGEVQWLPVLLFYPLYVAGVTALVVLPALRAGNSIGHVFVMGALFGLVAYATYDLTNQATIRDWPVIVTVVDLLWGTALTGIVSAVAVWALRATNGLS